MNSIISIRVRIVGMPAVRAFIYVIEKCNISKGQILRSTPNTAPLICGACNTQPEGLLTMA